MKSSWLTACVVAAVAILCFAQAKSDEPAEVRTPAADSMDGKKPGEVRGDNGLKLKLIWCPPGEFTMEQHERINEPTAKKDDDVNDDAVDPKDKPAPKPRMTTKITPVKVSLTQGYWVGKYEVTQSEWKKVMKTEPWKGAPLGEYRGSRNGSEKEGADFPATFVNWDDATDFCRKLTQQERQAGRLPKDWEYTLPTEAQWERACRARTQTKFSFGDDESKLGDYAWWGGVHGDGNAKTEQYAHQVGQKKGNPWGLFDMHGNVFEWCRDIDAEKLPGGRDPEVKPDEKATDSFRVIRGGGWNGDAASCRSAFRSMGSPSNRSRDLGFRAALSSVK